MVLSYHFIFHTYNHVMVLPSLPVVIEQFTWTTSHTLVSHRPSASQGLTRGPIKAPVPYFSHTFHIHNNQSNHTDTGLRHCPVPYFSHTFHTHNNQSHRIDNQPHTGLPPALRQSGTDSWPHQGTCPLFFTHISHS